MAQASTCEAVVTEVPGHVTTRQLGLKALGPRDVLVRSLVSGVSTGTDKWVMQGTFVWVDISYPSVPGYQVAGIIESVGSEVSGFRIGQSVAVTRAREYEGVASAWGTHASRVVAEVAEVYDAEEIPAARAAFIVSAQVGYNGASRLQLEAGARVLVVGDGIIGSSAALACTARGFNVLLAGRHDPRLELLQDMGLSTLNTRTGAPDAIAKFSPNAVIDTVQNEQAFAAYIPALPPRGGQLVYSGHSPGGITAWADMAVLQKHELSVHFVSGTTRPRLEATLALMRQGLMPCERLVGAMADSREGARELMTEVMHGRLRPVAAAIDWSWAQ